MLKTTALPERLTFKSLEVDNNEVDEFDVGGEDVEHAKKLGKSKAQKLFKSQKLSKSRKKRPKNGNLLNFDIKENKPSFLTLKNRVAFNRLRLTFAKALIL